MTLNKVKVQQLISDGKAKELFKYNNTQIDEVVPYFSAYMEDKFYKYEIALIDFRGLDHCPSDGGSTIFIQRSVKFEFLKNSNSEILKLLGISPDSREDDRKVEEVKKFLLKKFGNKAGFIWISDKGNIFMDKTKIKKVGKLLKYLNPNICDFELSNFIDKLKIMEINFSKQVKVTKKVTELYNSKKLKISSCMTNKGFSMKLLEDSGASVIFVEDKKGNIIARALLWENKYFDKVYATSTHLSSRFTEFLNRKYKNIPRKYNTSPIKVDGDTFYPYMDTMKYATKEDEYITLYSYNPHKIFTLNSTFGSLVE